MLYSILKIAKWISFPILLASGPLTLTGGRPELWLSVAVCVGLVIGAGISLWKKEYLLAAGLVWAAVAFSPFLLVTKIFLVLSLASIVTYLMLFAAFRQPAGTAQNDLET